MTKHIVVWLALLSACDLARFTKDQEESVDPPTKDKPAATASAEASGPLAALAKDPEELHRRVEALGWKKMGHQESNTGLGNMHIDQYERQPSIFVTVELHSFTDISQANTVAQARKSDPASAVVQENNVVLSVRESTNKPEVARELLKALTK